MTAPYQHLMALICWILYEKDSNKSDWNYLWRHSIFDQIYNNVIFEINYDLLTLPSLFRNTTGIWQHWRKYDEDKKFTYWKYLSPHLNRFICISCWSMVSILPQTVLLFQFLKNNSVWNSWSLKKCINSRGICQLSGDLTMV